MKKCAVIGFYGKSEYRKKVLQDIIDYFYEKNIDVIIASSDHVEKIDKVKNYITLKNVIEESYITPNIYSFVQIDNQKFFTGKRYKRNINPENYFIKQQQISAYYAKMLGYDYYYFLEFDAIIKKSYFDEITSDSWDYSKVHVYNFTRELNSTDYMIGFFHGNLDIATEIYKQENIDWSASLRLEKTIFGVENNLYHICQKYKQSVVEHPHTASDAFEKYNLFSTNNSAEIYFDTANNSYIYVQYRGDYFDNEFAAQLYLDDSCIDQGHLIAKGNWRIMRLENHRNYTIKYYDGPISDYTFHKSSTIYTDPSNQDTHTNWVSYV